MAAVLDRANLVASDNAADYRSPPVIIRGNQSPCAIVQFQCRISQCVGNAMLSELRTDSTHNDRLWTCPFNDEPANHHVVASLNERASTDVAQCYSIQVVTYDIEVDAFRRCSRNVRRLSGATERILDIRMRLWARGAQPITEIAAGVLIKIDDISAAAIDRKKTRTRGSDV